MDSCISSGLFIAACHMSFSIASLGVFGESPWTPVMVAMVTTSKLSHCKQAKEWWWCYIPSFVSPNDAFPLCSMLTAGTSLSCTTNSLIQNISEAIVPQINTTTTLQPCRDCNGRMGVLIYLMVVSCIIFHERYTEREREVPERENGAIRDLTNTIAMAGRVYEV